METIKLMNDRNVVLMPRCTLRVDKILKQWAEEWNETLETCTEKWELSDICLMGGGDVALLFRWSILEYVGNINDRVRSRIVCNMYRVIVFNIDGSFKGQYRFRLQAGYASHVYFIDGALYASIYANDGDNCTLLHMWPGSNDSAQKRMGKYSSSRAIGPDGRIYASCGGHDAVDEGEMWPVIAVYEDKKLKPLLKTDSFQGLRKIRLGEDGRIYGVTSDGKEGLVFDGEKADRFKLPVERGIDMAPANDGAALYIVTGADGKGCDCYRVPRDGNGDICQKLAIECGDEIIGHFNYCVIGDGIGAAYAGVTIYMFDLV